jgi:hypothetical protein
MSEPHDYGRLTREQIDKELADARKRAAKEAPEVAEATLKALERTRQLREQLKKKGK